MAMDISVFDYGNADWMTDDSLAEAQGLAVVLQSNGQFAVVTEAASPIFGVLVDDAPEGMAPSVRQGGLTYAIAGVGGVAPGDLVTNDAEGRFVVAAEGQLVHGQAVDLTAAEGEECRLKLHLEHRYAAPAAAGE